jgi:FixJ family two-component response regulator
VKTAPNQNRPVVLVVDDDTSVREALDSLIRSAGLSVETFPSAHAFLKYSIPNSPACLVLDVRLPGKSGLDLQRDLRSTSRTIPIIFITGHGDIPMSVRAMKAGAVEFLTKPFSDQDLLTAIIQAVASDAIALAEQSILIKLHCRYSSLTPREQQVMALVVKGFPNKEIAAHLGTAEITVKIQRGKVMKKMQATSLPDLVRWAETLKNHVSEGAVDTNVHTPSNQSIIDQFSRPDRMKTTGVVTSESASGSARREDGFNRQGGRRRRGK